MFGIVLRSSRCARDLRDGMVHTSFHFGLARTPADYADESVIVDFDGPIALATTVTLGSFEVTGWPLIVAVIVFSPAVLAVNVVV